MGDPRKIERVLQEIFLRRGYSVGSGADLIAEKEFPFLKEQGVIEVFRRNAALSVSINISELARELSHDL